MENKRVFISHSSLDRDFVGKVIDILEAVGIPSGKIFCSSFEGYGVKLGENFLEVLKQELNGEVLVLFLISDNFYKSPICLCEMGAAWVKTSQHIPILIPPFSYADIKGVFPTTHGMTLSEKSKFNTLKSQIETFLLLKPIDYSIWERKRDRIFGEIDDLIESKKKMKQN